MGALQEVADREHRFALRTSTVVGRGRQADLRLDSEHVSSLHAALLWIEGRWHIKDLGSHNGTIVAGRRLPVGGPFPVPEGAEIWFGAQASAWVLADAAPPAPIARDEQGELLIGEHGMLVLPAERGPSITVFRTSRGTWKVETDDGLVPAESGEIVVLDGRSWTLDLPELGVATQTHAGSVPLPLAQVRLRFSGAERVALTVERAGRTEQVGVGPHVDLLLELARARAEGQGEGWLPREHVTEALEMSANHLNVAIHRARKRLAAVGVEDAVSVVQRRRGRLRLGCTDVVLP